MDAQAKVQATYGTRPGGYRDCLGGASTAATSPSPNPIFPKRLNDSAMATITLEQTSHPRSRPVGLPARLHRCGAPGAGFLRLRRHREANPMRRHRLASLALLVALLGQALLAAPAHATPESGQPCNPPGNLRGRATDSFTSPWLVCWGNHVWVPYEPDIKVPLGSQCSGNTVPGVFGTTNIATVGWIRPFWKHLLRMV